MTGGPAEDVETDPAAAPAPSDAFQALAGEPRTAVLRALADDEPVRFADLHAATDVDTSAGFAYHLRQLDGQFVRQREDEAYELTTAGRAAVRAIESGAFTERVDRDRVELAENCPFCGVAALAAGVADSVTRIACEACDASILDLALPPSGYAARDAEDVPAAIDAYHRRRIETFAEGLCADCGAPVSAAIEPAATAPDAANGPAESDDGLRVQAAFDCSACGTDLRCPIALTVLDHPAVVAFFHDHGLDVRERPLWNVGPEWSERVLSRDPWCVVVRVALGGDLLEFYVAGDGRVVDHRRWNDFDDEASPADAGASPAGESASGDRSVPETQGASATEEAGGDGATA
jgi:hypothetical protein